MIEGLTAELASNEALKNFNTADDLAKSFLETHARVAAGGIDLLPEDLRGNETVKQYKTVSDIAKGLIETKKLVGTIEKPPATAAEYKFTMPENVHPSLKPTDEINKNFGDRFFKMGLSQTKADAIYKEFYTFQSEQITAKLKEVEGKRQVNETALRKEWGADYDKNFNSITRALAKAGGSEAKEVLDEVGASLKGNPLALRALGKIISQLSESTIDALGGPAGGAEVETEKEYSSYAEAIRTNDQKHPLFDRKHKDYKLAQEKWPKLQQAHFAKQKS